MRRWDNWQAVQCTRVCRGRERAGRRAQGAGRRAHNVALLHLHDARLAARLLGVVQHVQELPAVLVAHGLAVLPRVRHHDEHLGAGQLHQVEEALHVHEILLKGRAVHAVRLVDLPTARHRHNM